MDWGGDSRSLSQVVLRGARPWTERVRVLLRDCCVPPEVVASDHLKAERESFDLLRFAIMCRSSPHQVISVQVLSVFHGSYEP